jgi:hypothetical protein
MSAVRIVALLGVVLLVACGSGDGDSGDAEHRSLTIAICEQSDGWTKPSAGLQREQVWSQPAFAGRHEAQLQATFDEQFFAWNGDVAELEEAYALHGLWAAPDRRGIDACVTAEQVAQGRYVDVFVLAHRATEVTRSGSTYEVTVEPVESGFQRIEFSNELYAAGGPPVAYTVRIVNEDGEELASFERCASEDKMGCQSSTPTPTPPS